MKIVSANYRNRNSAYRWLIRDENEPIESARAFKAVQAKGVRFGASRAEEGFGCSIVAFCDEAIGREPEVRVTPLRFDGQSFRAVEGSRLVEACETLDLAPDGKMVATLAEG
jgi:hypothetical protein